MGDIARLHDYGLKNDYISVFHVKNDLGRFLSKTGIDGLLGHNKTFYVSMYPDPKDSGHIIIDLVPFTLDDLAKREGYKREFEGKTYDLTISKRPYRLEEMDKEAPETIGSYAS